MISCISAYALHLTTTTFVWYTHTIELNQHDEGWRMYKVVKMKPIQPFYPHLVVKNVKIEYTCVVKFAMVIGREGQCFFQNRFKNEHKFL